MLSNYVQFLSIDAEKSSSIPSFPLALKETLLLIHALGVAMSNLGKPLYFKLA